MRYYLHLVTDRGLVADREGTDFPNLAAAEKEALQISRDLIAEELRQGRPAPLGWELRLATADGTVRERIPFRPLVLSDISEQHAAMQRHVAMNNELRVRTQENMQAARSLNQEIKVLVKEIRERLRSAKGLA